MQQLGFNEAIDLIIQRDARFDRDAYAFVRDALEFTLKKSRKGAVGPERHVSAKELLEGVRLYAIQEYGPMVPTVFAFWNIRSGNDIGAIVYNLIEVGVFGRSENDRPADFAGALDFEEAFILPYLPDRLRTPDISERAEATASHS